jgi:class 3 adenylate cyclase
MTTRRLAAILAADVVGFSKLIGEDEAGTLSALREIRKGIVNPVLAEHGGRIFKLMGDGLLAEFPSAVQALRPPELPLAGRARYSRPLAARPRRLRDRAVRDAGHLSPEFVERRCVVVFRPTSGGMNSLRAVASGRSGAELSARTRTHWHAAECGFPRSSPNRTCCGHAKIDANPALTCLWRLWPSIARCARG